MSAEKDVEQSYTVWQKAPKSTFFIWFDSDLTSGMCS